MLCSVPFTRLQGEGDLANQNAARHGGGVVQLGR